VIFAVVSSAKLKMSQNKTIKFRRNLFKALAANVKKILLNNMYVSSGAGSKICRFLNDRLMFLLDCLF
jgi:hypothetical protein